MVSRVQMQNKHMAYIPSPYLARLDEGLCTLAVTATKACGSMTTGHISLSSSARERAFAGPLSF